MTSKTWRISLLVIRIILGLVFLLSGIGKLIDSGYVNYDLVRLLSSEFFWVIEYAAIIIISISVVELVIALFLLWGKYLKWAMGSALVMLLLFSSVLGYYYVQGINVEGCGCFGAFGFGSGLEVTLIRNTILALLVIGGLTLDVKKRKNRDELRSSITV